MNIFTLYFTASGQCNETTHRIKRNFNEKNDVVYLLSEIVDNVNVVASGYRILPLLCLYDRNGNARRRSNRTRVLNVNMYVTQGKGNVRMAQYVVAILRHIRYETLFVRPNPLTTSLLPGRWFPVCPDLLIYCPELSVYRFIPRSEFYSC